MLRHQDIPARLVVGFQAPGGEDCGLASQFSSQLALLDSEDMNEMPLMDLLINIFEVSLLLSVVRGALRVVVVAN